MATQNLPTSAIQTVASEQSDKLFDVLAMLQGAQHLIEKLEAAHGEDCTTDYLKRLVSRASEDVLGATTALTTFI
jgi:hypothetical protein